ncbi:type IV pilin N-terminal domain-containing protein [Haloplanus pelagicus]|jgi:flagellin-like protein|uniref:type IV pilin N-terminal domain-containing protein n=1 Tax=Haloplanus pelagicus TaxID=2949995 RepID=UPI002040F2BE|nr:type IV pilin N-terminal domain-containing protein [Haloplanus sp. HW8-1]
MGSDAYERERAASAVVGLVLLVAIVVIISTAVSAFVLTEGSDVPPPSPTISVSHTTIDDGGDATVAVTLEDGDAVRIDRLYVSGSKALDIGGPPGGAHPADESYASERERFSESSGGRPPQVGIGDTWEAGETVYLDPTGTTDGVRIRIYWNTEPVRGVNPGTVRGDDAYELVEFTVSPSGSGD